MLGFHGINFRSGFDLSEAKEMLNAEMDALESDMKTEYGDLSRRRPAITTALSPDSVWDCFGHVRGFTKDLHFTFSIAREWHDISIVIPNSAVKRWSRLKEVLNDENKKLYERLLGILRELRKKVPHLYIEFIQRHFKTQKLAAYRDGYLEFSMDTIAPQIDGKDSKVKETQVWLDALKHAIIKKRHINGQVMFKCRFFYGETKELEGVEFLETARSTIRALRPLYLFLRGSIQPKA